MTLIEKDETKNNTKLSTSKLSFILWTLECSNIFETVQNVVRYKKRLGDRASCKKIMSFGIKLQHFLNFKGKYMFTNS